MARIPRVGCDNRGEAVPGVSPPRPLRRTWRGRKWRERPRVFWRWCATGQGEVVHAKIHHLPSPFRGRSLHSDPWREGHRALPRSGRINRPVRFPHRRRDLRSLRGKSVQEAFWGALLCQGVRKSSLAGKAGGFRGQDTIERYAVKGEGEGSGGGDGGARGALSPSRGFEGAEPLASPSVLHWVGWLPFTTRCGAGPAVPASHGHQALLRPAAVGSGRPGSRPNHT